MRIFLGKTGIIKKGSLHVNKSNVDVANWRVKVFKDRDYLILLEKPKNQDFEYWYDFMVESEDLILKFFEETDWEIEWKD